MIMARTLAIVVLMILAGCSASGMLTPNALTMPRQDAATSPETAQGALLAASNPQLAIERIVGAPDAAIAPLNARLAARARDLGIPLNEAVQDSGLSMRGYFSAITEGRETAVIYVWDVIDAEGNRLTRIQGQERAPRLRGEGWTSVRPELMHRVADQTIDAYASWLLARAG